MSSSPAKDEGGVVFQFREILYDASMRLISQPKSAKFRHVGQVLEFLEQGLITTRPTNEGIRKIEESIIEGVNLGQQFSWVGGLPRILLTDSFKPTKKEGIFVDPDYAQSWVRIAVALDRNHQIDAIRSTTIFRTCLDILISSGFPNGFSTQDEADFSRYLKLRKDKARYSEEVLGFLDGLGLLEGDGVEEWNRGEIHELRRYNKIHISKNDAENKLGDWKEKTFDGGSLDERLGDERTDWVVKSIEPIWRKIEFVSSPSQGISENLSQESETETDYDIKYIREWILSTVEGLGGFVYLSALGNLWLQEHQQTETLSRLIRAGGEKSLTLLIANSMFENLHFSDRNTTSARIRILGKGEDAQSLLSGLDYSKNWLRAWMIPADPGDLENILRELNSYLALNPRPSWNRVDYKAHCGGHISRFEGTLLSVMIDGAKHEIDDKGKEALAIDPMSILNRMFGLIRKRCRTTPEVDPEWMEEKLQELTGWMIKGDVDDTFASASPTSWDSKEELHSRLESERRASIDARKERAERKRRRERWEKERLEAVRQRVEEREETARIREIDDNLGPLGRSPSIVGDFVKALEERPENSEEFDVILSILYTERMRGVSRGRLTGINRSDKVVWMAYDRDRKMQPKLIIKSLLSTAGLGDDEIEKLLRDS